MIKRITCPMDTDQARALRAGDQCLLTGVIYAARDAAHKQLCQWLREGQPLPMALKDAVIYYVGPAPAREDQVIGSAGPTTSYRMDAYSPTLIALGQTGMIGKGKRSPEVVEAMKKHGAVYFGATGGCGALLSRCIRSSRVIGCPELGPEAIRLLEVEDFPVTVIIDSQGNNLYDTGRQAYLLSRKESRP